jgi:mRNA interferase RelE/StbE
MYNITITKKAHKALKALTHKPRERIAESIQKLAHNPDDMQLDVKTLVNHDIANYRLRVGDYRVLFNRDDEIRVIAIERISHRQEAY